MPGSVPPTIEILIVDDSELVLSGLKAVFEGFPKDAGMTLHVAGEANTASLAVAECARLKPAVVLLDIRLPDGSGLEVCRQILATDPEIKILILTSVIDDSLVYDAMSAGAHGYLLKDIDARGLCQAVADVAKGKFILDPAVTAHVLNQIHNASTQPKEPDKLLMLSAQEQRVLALVAEGKTNKETAEQMGLSHKTVKNYLSNIFEKLKISRRSQAAVFFSERRSRG